jgi:cytochrome c
MKIGIASVAVSGALALAATAAHAALDDAKAQELMKKGGCAACHSVDKKIVGPAYKDVAQKRKGQKDALATLEKAVRSGSNGAYGQIPMPPNPKEKISDADLHQLVEWVLSK